MPRLIDAYKVRIDRDDFDTYSDYITALDAVTEAPTVDAEPVIRCCDCVHFKYFENQFFQMTRCDVHDRCPNYTDFCSWAERKEE